MYTIHRDSTDYRKQERLMNIAARSVTQFQLLKKDTIYNY